MSGQGARKRDRGLVVAIDGPAGAGKSTAARVAAARLGYTLVDTGAMYRAVALAALEAGLDLDDGEGVGALARGLDLQFEPGADGAPRLFLDGRDRSDAIRHPHVSAGASRSSRHPSVRAALLGLQRKLGDEGGVVLEGRDIGTVVFPDAEVKVFLTATPEERANRRVAELTAKGHDVDYDQTLAQIRERDASDASRDVAPMRPAEDAVQLDSTQMSLDEVVDRIVSLVRTRRS